MLQNFRRWFIENNLEITWFLIGLLVSSGIDQLARGHYGSAAFSFGIAYLNFVFRKL